MLLPRRTRLTRTAIALLAPLPLLAQTAPTPLPRVDVISVTPLPGLGVPKDQVPSNVQTSRAVEIDRSQAVDLSSFMNRRLGSVHINEVQNNPFQPDVNFRGFTASPLLGTQQGLSVYVDGVRLNQPFGDVVSWDLIPKSAIASIALMPGSNPLFGLNTLGGALSIQTKDGLSNPGSSVQLLAGSNRRVAAEFETGGGNANSVNWFVTGNRFHEQGWRSDSPSDVAQLFGKFGTSLGDGSVSLTLSAADNNLNGNGLQEQRLLAASYRSVYTRPDNTKNRALLLNLAATQRFGNGLSFSGNAYWRRIKTATFNGDLNSSALGQDVYQPGSGEDAANTPFPRQRCIAEALPGGDPASACSGLLNTTDTLQTNHGIAVQVSGQAPLAWLAQQWLIGAALDISRVHFRQDAELGYVNPDRSISGVGAPADAPVDLRARTRTWSLFASDTLALNAATHLTVSGRYNRTTVANRDAITPGGGPGSLDGDHVFSRLNPAAGLTFAASPALTAYAGINQGSRAPSAIELGCADPASPCKLPNAMAGDPPLKQVVTTTVEAGLRGGTGTTRWNVGVFRADNKDDILFVADNQAGFGYFRNFGKTRRQGIEAGVSTRIGEIGVGANLTFIDATYRSDEVVNGSGNSSNDSAEGGLPGVDGNIEVRAGHRIPLVPRRLLKLFAEVPLSAAVSVGVDITAIGGSFARGNENNAHRSDGIYYLGPGRSGGYAVLNLNTEWRPTPGLKLFAQVNNLFDRRYSTAAQLGATGFDANGNFVARPFAANANGDRPLLHSTFHAPGAPRSFWVGVRYDIGE